MTETSRFWDGTTLGDASAAPYDAATKFSEAMNSISGAASKTNLGGVFSELNQLAVTAAGGVASPVSVATGTAIVYGTWYKSDAITAFAVASPVSATRTDRVVLRKSWASQTVRLMIIQGVEGGGEPALVQNAGTTWDVPVASWTITTGGVVTVTDERQIIGATSGASWPTNVTALTPYSVAGGDVAVITTAATPTVHLPAAPTSGRVIVVKHGGTLVGTIDVTGGASIIWTTAPVASLTLGVGDSYTFVGDGTYWRVIG